MTEEEVLISHIDTAIENLVLANIPPVVEIMAEGFAQVLTRGFSEADRAEFKAQVEVIVRERLRAYSGHLASCAAMEKSFGVN